MSLRNLILFGLAASALLSLFAVGLQASLQDATYLFRRPGELVRALLAMNVLMPAIGHVLGGPIPQNQTALAIATASRHPGIALILATANFPAETLVGPALLLYLLVNAVVAIPYLLWTKRRQL